MRHLIMLAIVSALFFFGCEANNAGGNSDIAGGSTHGSTESQEANSDNDTSDDSGIAGVSNEDDASGIANDASDDSGIAGVSNEDDVSLGADLCLGTTPSRETATLDDGEDYRRIRDQTGLEAIKDDVTAKYILCNNISLNGPFTRIGGEFTGTLEGNHKTILELEIRAQNSYFVGLFGAIAASGKVRNLKISLVDRGATTPSISGLSIVGALAGENRGTIINVGVTDGYVKGDSSIGGLVGQNEGGTITKSYAISKVKGTADSIGGLVGANTGTIENSYAAGNVEGNNYIGGLVGWNDNSTITNSYAAGTVTGTGFDIGELIGFNGGRGTITASYYAIPTGQSPTGYGTAFYTGDDGFLYAETDGNNKITEDSFEGWAFPDPWYQQEEGRWPLLQFQTMTTQ